MVDSEKKLGLAGSPAVAINIELMNWPFESFFIPNLGLDAAYEVSTSLCAHQVKAVCATASMWSQTANLPGASSVSGTYVIGGTSSWVVLPLQFLSIPPEHGKQ